MKKLFLLLNCIAPAIIFGQEICDDAIDNDGDGLIDLNDPDCDCNGISGFSPLSLIPNPSFEDYTLCPDASAQLNRARDWVQASIPTTDYYHDCGFNTFPSFDAARPLPNGEGWVGFRSSDIPGRGVFAEYAGNCLTSTMKSGRAYTLGVWLEHAYGNQTFEFSLFGAENCSELPWNGLDCPEGLGTWHKLADTLVTIKTSEAWQQVIFSFTPTADINTIALGGPCNPSERNYYYIDDLQITDSMTFVRKGKIIETPLPCQGFVELEFQIDTIGWTCQWYKDGIALVGETDAKLDASQYGLGKFSVRYILGVECDIIEYILSTEVETYPTPEANFTSNEVCQGSTTSFMDQSTISAGTIEEWSWDFGDGGTSKETNPFHTFTSSGTFNSTLTVVSSDGCKNEITLPIVVNAHPKASFNIISDDLNDQCEGVLPIDAVFQNTSTSTISNTTYSWNLNYNIGDWIITSDINADIDTSYKKFGAYNVCLIVTNDECIDTACKLISVLDLSEFVEKINVFSPNSDGINDLFSLNTSDEVVTAFSCQIINRWGVKVAELNSPSETWNGFNFEGNKCAEGVYYYVYSGNNWLGEPFSGHGAVQIVR